MVNKGDRIELTAPMEYDPNPIEVGSKGEVTFVNEVGGHEPFTQISVKWDNGRTLMLATPPDQFRILDGISARRNYKPIE